MYISRLSLAGIFISIAISYIYLYILNPKQSKPVVKMASTALLFVSNIIKVPSFLKKSCEFAKNVLYIKVESTSNAAMNQAIVDVYTKATSHCSKLDVRLILKPMHKEQRIKTQKPIDLILHDTKMCNIDSMIQSVAMLQPSYKVQCVDVPSETPESPAEQESVTMYDYVVLGGTFDRLHNGHKVLLSQAALRTSKLLTVGVTDVNMIQTKKLWELIEPVETRVQSVLDFLTDINPDIEYNVIPIQDIYGPTKDDPRFQLLVLSAETARGGAAVAAARAARGLPALARLQVPLAPDAAAADHEEGKLSSSNQRMRLLGTLLRRPEPNPSIPRWPYVVGLAGGIASGKTNIARLLEEKGAGVVDCDALAHELYAAGAPLNASVARAFGPGVLAASGDVDRARLGEIVFGDPRELEKLNALAWPAIISEAERRTAALGARGRRVVVLEAAVLVRAGWARRVHQLWAAIVPEQEAIRRLQERNNLSPAEAARRVAAQTPNAAHAAAAHVLLSPQWSRAHTRRQVDRAWAMLQRLLDDRDA